MKQALTILTIALFLCTALAAQDRPTPFTPDSAAGFLRVLSVDIGPRPMGSPGEQAAMQYAVGQFTSFGLDESYILPFDVAPSQRMAGANTKSGTAVGVLRGASDRIIVIGGHIDSYAPEGPGANDDGSGSAVVLELARVMAQREWESTIVFCLFGGEESGLKGSYHFADAWPDMEKVVLMLQVDMANGSEWLVPLLDVKGHSAPPWLVNASYEEIEKLGYERLFYPTHFFTLNRLAGGASSDHEPFLRKGIPAIDFTTDIRDVIHSPNDSYENFVLGGLERSGDLVYRLTERFDQGTPERDTSLFVTFQLGGSVYLLPYWLLWVIIVLSLGAAFFALREIRPLRTELRGQERPNIPGLKVFLLTLMTLFLLWFSEDLVSLLSGLRSPWYSDPGAMIPVALLGGGIGIWISGYLAGRMSFSADLYRYLLRAIVTLTVFLLLSALTGPALTVYPALGLIFMSLIAFTRRGWLAIALLFCGVYPTYRLFDSEVFEFVARTFAMIPPGGDIFVTAILSIVTALLAIPYALVLAGIVISDRYQWPRLPYKPSHPAVVVVLIVAWIGAAINVMSAPAYAGVWEQRIDVTQEVSVTSGDLRTIVRSHDILDGTSISYMAFDTLIAGDPMNVVLPTLPFTGSAWLSSDVTPAADGSGAIARIHTWTRPYTLEVKYATKGGSDKSTILSASAGLYSMDIADGAATSSFYSFPDTLILFPVSLTLDQPDTVYQTIVATFIEPAVPVSVNKDNSFIIHRTIVRESKEFYVTKTAAQPHEGKTEGDAQD